MKFRNKVSWVIFLVLGISALTHAQPCEDGMAGEYPCSGINQYAFMPSDEIGGGVMNDNWGWVSPETGREYAIQCRSNGTSFIDITNPSDPVYIGNLPTHDIEILWRDAKVYANHAFIVAESPAHGMQVFDLTQLDEVENPPVVFSETAHYSMFGNAHNIAINEQTGFAYAVGSDTYSGGLHIIDIQNPTEPELAGGFEADGYTHDVQVVIYDGFDATYNGKEIAFAANENSLTIVDVTDKTDPQMISRSEYENSAYAHQGWLTEDHRYFLLGDELDEGTFGVNTRTFVWDLINLEEPVLVGVFESDLTSIDHNLYIKGDYCYQANYTGGLRVLKLNNLADMDIEEVAYFDVIPESDNVQFIGSWNVYPFFPSGTIILSNMYQGFHVLQPDFDISSDVESVSETSISLFPNPASEYVRIADIPADINSLYLYDMSGRLMWSEALSGETEKVLMTDRFPSGMYVLKAGDERLKLAIR